MANEGVRRPGEFTEQQEAFIAGYCRHCSARRAATDAGYEWPETEGWRLLQKPHIAKEISKRRGAVRRRNEHIEDQVIHGLARIAEASISDVTDFAGGTLLVKTLADIPEEIRPAIKSVTIQPGQHGDRIKVEMHDKVKALELLGKYMALFADRQVVEGGDEPVKHELVVKTPLSERLQRLKRINAGEEDFSDL